MPDDKKKTGKQDDIRISPTQPHELRDWAKKFKVTPDKIKEAVKKVGPMAANVKKYLDK